MVHNVDQRLFLYIPANCSAQFVLRYVFLKDSTNKGVLNDFFYFAAKLVPVGYGIKKLQIQCVVEDDKVGTDMLEERITAFEDYVQSMDVAAFNKI